MSVRRKLLGQGDCRAFPGAQASLDEKQLARRTLDLQPIRRTGNPLLHNGWCPFFAELSDDDRGHQDATVKGRQDVAVFDENQISERTGVGDADHQARRWLLDGPEPSACRFSHSCALVGPSRSKSSSEYSSGTPCRFRKPSSS